LSIIEPGHFVCLVEHGYVMLNLVLLFVYYVEPDDF
jgi:hypothetical protein